MSALPDVVVQRLLAKVHKDPSGCWFWTGHRNACGYGVFRVPPHTRLAHRVMYLHAKGEIPDGLVVMHDCDEPACVNPEHLHLGTMRENTRQMFRRNRSNRQRFTPEQVQAIREDPRHQRVIAAAYGTSQSNVSAIKSRTNWSYV